MDFNKERFCNFARYDLIINSRFYRNLSLVPLIGAVSIVACSCSLTYLVHSITGDYDHSGYTLFSVIDYFTACCLACLLNFMMLAFAGCWAHNLRTKQGRITELTLPATNLEKFVWHMGLMIVGGLLVCIVSLLLADAVNALLTLLISSNENLQIVSITSNVFECISGTYVFNNHMVGFNLDEIAQAEGYEHITYITYLPTALATTSLTGLLYQISLFAFGNALKYKYNIILTYLILQAVAIAVAIIGFVAGAIIILYDDTLLPTFFTSIATDSFSLILLNYIISAISIALVSFFVWKSFRLYEKAQITSPRNQ